MYLEEVIGVEDKVREFMLGWSGHMRKRAKIVRVRSYSIIVL